MRKIVFILLIALIFVGSLKAQLIISSRRYFNHSREYVPINLYPTDGVNRFIYIGTTTANQTFKILRGDSVSLYEGQNIFSATNFTYNRILFAISTSLTDRYRGLGSYSRIELSGLSNYGLAIDTLNLKYFSGMTSLFIDGGNTDNLNRLKKVYFPRYLNYNAIAISLLKCHNYDTVDLSRRYDLSSLIINPSPTTNSGKFPKKLVLPDSTKFNFDISYKNLKAKYAGNAVDTLDFKNCKVATVDLQALTTTKLKINKFYNDYFILSMFNVDIDTVNIGSCTSVKTLGLTSMSNLKKLYLPISSVTNSPVNLTIVSCSNLNISSIDLSNWYPQKFSLSLGATKDLGYGIKFKRPITNSWGQMNIVGSMVDSLNFNNITFDLTSNSEIIWNIKQNYYLKSMTFKNVILNTTVPAMGATTWSHYFNWYDYKCDTLDLSTVTYNGSSTKLLRTFIQGNYSAGTAIKYFKPIPTPYYHSAVIYCAKSGFWDLSNSGMDFPSNVGNVASNAQFSFYGLQGTTRKIKIPTFSYFYNGGFYIGGTDTIDITNYKGSTILNLSGGKIYTPTTCTFTQVDWSSSVLEMRDGNVKDTLKFGGFSNLYKTIKIYNQSSRLLKRIYWPTNSQNITSLLQYDNGEDTVDISGLINLGLVSVPTTADNSLAYTVQLGGSTVKNIKFPSANSNYHVVTINRCNNAYTNLDLSFTGNNLCQLFVNSDGTFTSSFNKLKLPSSNRLSRLTFYYGGTRESLDDTLNLSNFNSLGQTYASGNGNISIWCMTKRAKTILMPDTLMINSQLYMYGDNCSNCEENSAIGFEEDTLKLNGMSKLTLVYLDQWYNLKRVIWPRYSIYAGFTVVLNSTGVDTLDVSDPKFNDKLSGITVQYTRAIKKIKLPSSMNRDFSLNLNGDHIVMDTLDLRNVSKFAGLSISAPGGGSLAVSLNKLRMPTTNTATSDCGFQLNAVSNLDTVDASALTNLGGTVMGFYIYRCANLKYLKCPNTTKFFSSVVNIQLCAGAPNVDNLSGMTNLFNRASTTFNLTGNNWSAAQVNKILYDINTSALAGYSGRVINLSGSTQPNAAPDNSSGGIDGIAAKNALIAKGFTVTTN